ncbi:hypothetical protein RHI9324_04683 [Rhizobium sp. CECT 9324]|nr:hypothetical protein RHI9324_04683 [Rhizobium sp. CECT 9324]
MSPVHSYRGDAVKSKATGTVSADAVNAHTAANLIRRIFRARSSFHSYAIPSPPGGNEAFRGISVEPRKMEDSSSYSTKAKEVVPYIRSAI